MAFSHGKNTYFALADTADETTADDISSYLHDVSFPETVETAQSSTYGSSAHTYVVGLKDSTISLRGKWDPTIDAVFANNVGNEIPLAWEYGPVGNTAGNVKYSQAGGTGNPGAILTSYEISSPLTDVVMFSVELQVSDEVTRGTF